MNEKQTNIGGEMLSIRKGDYLKLLERMKQLEDKHNNVMNLLGGKNKHKQAKK